MFAAVGGTRPPWRQGLRCSGVSLATESPGLPGDGAALAAGSPWRGGLPGDVASLATGLAWRPGGGPPSLWQRGLLATWPPWRRGLPCGRASLKTGLPGDGASLGPQTQGIVRDLAPQDRNPRNRRGFGAWGPKPWESYGIWPGAGGKSFILSFCFGDLSCVRSWVYNNIL